MSPERSSRPLRYLSAAQVRLAMPALPERLDLAELVLRSLGGQAELPPKIGVHPRQAGSLAQAMPALLHGSAPDGSGDLLGVKWIAGFPDNLSLGLPAYHALVLLNDPRTGLPLAVVDGGAITAARTAAVSGVALRLLGGAVPGIRAAVLGAGAQAESHLPVLAHLAPGATVRLVDRDGARAEALARAAASIEGLADAAAVATVQEAVDGADVVVSVVSFGPHRQTLDPGWLAPDALFVAVDYDMQAPAALARAGWFLVDEREQFLATRSDSVFAGYPEPESTLGDVLRAGRAGPAAARPAGRVLVSHLGVGLADVVFAAAVLGRAEDLGLGLALPR